VLTALVAIAIGPGLFLMHRAYAADLHEPEPVPHVFWYSVVGGSCSFWLALTVGLVIGPAVGFAFQLPIRSLPGQTLAIFLCVALVEELMKLLLLVGLARGDHEIDEPFDWLVYAVAIGLGFATTENLFYVLRGGMAVGWARALTAVPAHAAFGTTMGLWMARASLSSGRTARHARLLALLEPTLWHGAYDTLALVGQAHRAPLYLMVLFVAGLLGLNALRVANLQMVTERAWPVPPICYPLRFRLGRRRPPRRPVRSGICCVCQVSIGRVLRFPWDVVQVRIDVTTRADAHARCVRLLRWCALHGERHIGLECPLCRLAGSVPIRRGDARTLPSSSSPAPR